ncbi:MAG: hypothetical protein A2Y00_02415 [Omnitrophica WOR_2 bacterium GWF2_43_52]|nr:MAG: hypothetical protein A2062_03210 [Omnitrophica WOR_2 bacterium GWA2_44_7]OGX14601.1 MAG: hypothetical protein A2Y01_06310 [Omnitrophica WOR_2 bacterium GWC2_44_8]OGX20294.1 MAG: hypothetical protein A2Y00_02415 [Omnitrophica WOR_2 bacterium GWF2_43_52]HAH21276.1 hypothetical protein [Candidatus Omnitrophota bacterium]HBG63912.1 hypothetical protein [Candidatus Omnitrophota bacterium]
MPFIQRRNKMCRAYSKTKDRRSPFLSAKKGFPPTETIAHTVKSKRFFTGRAPNKTLLLNSWFCSGRAPTEAVKQSGRSKRLPTGFTPNKTLLLNSRFCSGFTLIEMLIVAVTFSVISLALYASLSNGIRIWQRIYNNDVAPEEREIFLDRFAHDLRNSGSFQMIDFLGEKDSLTFQTIVNSRQLQKTTVGKVSYGFNQQTATLDREEADFSRVCEGKDGVITHSLSNIRSLAFYYYYYSKEDKEYLWLDEAASDMPLAVRMKMEYLDEQKNETFVTTVAIPVSG